MNEALTKWLKKIFHAAIGFQVFLVIFHEELAGTAYFYTKNVCEGIILVTWIFAWAIPWILLKHFAGGVVSLATLKKDVASRTFKWVLLFAVGMTGCEIYFHSCAVTRMALADLSTSSQATKMIGLPIRAGWLISYSGSGNSFIYGAGSWTVDMSIPVHGSKGAAQLTVHAEDANGMWKIESLHLLCDRCNSAIEITPQ